MQEYVPYVDGSDGNHSITSYSTYLQLSFLDSPLQGILMTGSVSILENQAFQLVLSPLPGRQFISFLVKICWKAFTTFGDGYDFREDREVSMEVFEAAH